MLDERRFIARLEATEPEEYARILAHPGREEEEALRKYLGDHEFERQHELATQQQTRGAAPKRGNVVVIHGIMGGMLSTMDRERDEDRVWVNYFRLLCGALERLWLAADGVAERDPRWKVLVTGMIKKVYGKQLLRLAADWNVRGFSFDWRKDLRLAADRLAGEIERWFGRGAPVHIVAHSMGGLVARSFIVRHPDVWEGIRGGGNGGPAGGRLIMLGTPNQGSFAVPQILTGLEGLVRKLALLDVAHSLDEVLEIVGSFPGSYQMLPSPFAMDRIEELYRSAAWHRFAVPQARLDDARAFHSELRDAVDAGRMVYVAGYNRVTLCGLRTMDVGSRDDYEATLLGDGRVPHTLGLLDGVPTYYVDEVHSDLPRNEAVLAALNGLLETGKTEELPTKIPALRSLRSRTAIQEALAEERAREAAEERELEMYARRDQLRGEMMAEGTLLTDTERRATSILLRGWLEGEAEPTVVEAPSEPRDADAASDAPALRIDLLHGDISRTPDTGKDAPDAIAVGHYIGVRPQFAERALDASISRKVAGLGPGKQIPESDLLLTAYTERGTIRGDLGHPFLLPDPRRSGRVIALAGMGVPGRFGSPELAVLARELVWVLGRIGARHLATVLIGSGAGNLEPDEAVAGWVRGARQALAGSRDVEPAGRIERITIVERDPERVIAIDRALAEEVARPDRSGAGVKISYARLTKRRVSALRKAAAEQRIARAAETREDDPAEREPTRVTLTVDRRQGRAVYRFGAITRDASVPEREVILDPKLVDEANDELPRMSDFTDQLRRGQYMERLLVPRDLGAAMATSAPLVMVLDAAAARVHWEMVAQPEVGPPENATADVEGSFLATSRGFTRQLRTTFSPVPEAPPPSRRPLRVLIVADPAEDAPLPGAREEANALYDLFVAFNDVYARAPRPVEVRRLSGPHDATRTAVLEALFTEQYDVLHFAGHCIYDAEEPSASGWIFGRDARLSANELRRVDHIPKFVFSNACESGITPDRSEKREAALAPSFAEAFFERGVANFVCTAWPIDDSAALAFACRLYAGLLGLEPPTGAARGGARTPLAMHVAMKEARVAVARMARGRRSWGAYQHYGNPYFRFFQPEELHG